MTDLSTLRLSDLRKEYNLYARVLYAATTEDQATRARTYLDALKAEAERRGKDIRPARKIRL